MSDLSYSLGEVCAASFALALFFMPLYGVVFRLGWLFADYSVRYIKDTVRLFFEVLVERVVGPMWLRHKTKGKEDKE
nr:hypothetical protein [uncultured Oscillibacter sp.]